MVASTSKMSKLIHGAGTSKVNSDVRSAALFWIVSLLFTGLLAIVVSMLGITPARSGTLDVRSVTVSYRDLDLSRPAAANALYWRIQAAAKQVCGHPEARLIERRIWRDCYCNALSDAICKVTNPLLTALRRLTVGDSRDRRRAYRQKRDVIAARGVRSTVQNPLDVSPLLMKSRTLVPA